MDVTRHLPIEIPYACNEPVYNEIREDTRQIHWRQSSEITAIGQFPRRPARHEINETLGRSFLPATSGGMTLPFDRPLKSQPAEDSLETGLFPSLQLHRGDDATVGPGVVPSGRAPSVGDHFTILRGTRCNDPARAHAE